MEFNDRTQEDVLERLAYAEQLVVELKEIIRQKDAQLQQKDEVLQVNVSLLSCQACDKRQASHLGFSLRLDFQRI